jgi:hypothetical protein
MRRGPCWTGPIPIGDVRVVTGYGETLDVFAEAVWAASASEA